MISTRDYRNKLYDLEETKLKSIIAGFDVLIEAFRQEYVVQETDPNTKFENIAELIGFYNLLIREMPDKKDVSLYSKYLTDFNNHNKIELEFKHVCDNGEDKKIICAVFKNVTYKFILTVNEDYPCVDSSTSNSITNNNSITNSCINEFFGLQPHESDIVDDLYADKYFYAECYKTKYGFCPRRYTTLELERVETTGEEYFDINETDFLYKQVDMITEDPYEWISEL